MQDLIEYAERFDAGYGASIRGASSREIATLEELVGEELPATYRAYLQALGHQDGHLELVLDGSTSIDDVIAFYREAAVGEHIIPADCIVVGVGSVTMDELALYQSPGRVEPSVVVGDGVGGVARLHADSLGQLLFRTVFCQKKAAGYACARYLARPDTDPIMPTFDAAMSELGFEKEWFSDSVFGCYDRGDAQIFMYQDEGVRPGAKASASDAAGLERLLGQVAARTGLRSQE